MEFSPATAIRDMLATQGTAIPASGNESIDHVIAAYNNFETVKIGGIHRQLFSLKWAYRGGCPMTRICAPSDFDAAACLAVRTDHGEYDCDFSPADGAAGIGSSTQCALHLADGTKAVD